MNGEPYTYDRFQPGMLIGQQDLRIDRTLIDRWTEVYGERPKAHNVPLGVVSVIVMRAHSAIVSPRPPGNIHVGQRFTVHAPIELGQDLRATVTCREKRISGTRKIVIFSVGIADAASGEPLLEGVNTMFWAA